MKRSHSFRCRFACTTATSWLMSHQRLDPTVPRRIPRGFNVGCGRSGRQYRLLHSSSKGRALGTPSPN